MTKVVPGEDGDPLPDSSTVFRLCRSNDGKVAPEAFALSSEEKKAEVPRLSVWEESLTTLPQAHSIMGRDPRYTLAGLLAVADVRALRPHPDDPAVQSLDVEWEQAMVDVDGERVPNTQAGAEGHAGIVRLKQQGQDAAGQGLRRYEKSLRRRLAELANERVAAID